MKVRVSFTIDIDTHAWEANFGTPAEDIRSDVKQYTEYLAVQALDSQGVLA